MKETRIILTEEMLKYPIEFEFSEEVIYIDRSQVGVKKERYHNLIGFARREKHVKDLVIRLVINGYFLVSSVKGNSKFQKFTTAKKFKENIKTNKLRTYKDLFYTLNAPKVKFGPLRLIVIFSSVAASAYNADIAQRNFVLNFASISTYIPQNTYILRVADVGGVVGNFYMNTTFSPNIENNIQKLILYILEKYSISQEDVVLYGASKGGTAALYHGILGAYKAVAVDPMISDREYEECSDDSHFTLENNGNKIYLQTKQEKFTELMNTYPIPDDINIVYSSQSPIFDDINSIIKNNDLNKRINYINVNHPFIKRHADVAMYSINILLLLINNLFYNIGSISSTDVDSNYKFGKLKVVYYRLKIFLRKVKRKIR